MQQQQFRLIALAGMAITLSACSATQHRAEVLDDSVERVTVGTVQREVTVGMSSAQVAAVLGTPNIVSTDAERREVWIYDKISTDVSYSRSGGVVAGLVVGSSGGGGFSGVGISLVIATIHQRLDFRISRKLSTPCTTP